MCKMVLVVEVEQPLLMGSQQVFPGLCLLKMPVGEPSLGINYVELNSPTKCRRGDRLHSLYRLLSHKMHQVMELKMSLDPTLKPTL